MTDSHGQLSAVRHRRVDVDGIATFYREAGPAAAPVVLLPHGYPASSYAFRNLMAALGDRWRLVAPDAELHLLGGGHWLLETHLDEVVPLVRRFLTRLDEFRGGGRSDRA